MSELKVGDVVYIKGDKAVIKKITKSDSDSEPLLEVAITSTRLGYLSPSALDLYAIDELNKDQKIVLEWLKMMCPKNFKVSPMVVIRNLVDEALDESWREHYNYEPKYIKAVRKLENPEDILVLQAFTEWWLSENEK